MKLNWHFQKGQWTATNERGTEFIIYPEYESLRQYHLYYRLSSWGHDVKHSSHRFLGDAKRAAENWRKKEASHETNQPLC